jgi:hypothetical protein
MHTSENIAVLCVIKVSNLETALCNMQGMIWEDTDALYVGIYILHSWIYYNMNKLMLLNQNNFYVKNTEVPCHTVLSHCIPVRDSLFSSVSA